MTRAILLLAGGLLACGPALAEGATAAQGRYQIAPDGDGFVRLDTETGALAHCDRSNGVWRCTSVVEDLSGIEGRLLALEEELAALRTDLEELSKQIADVEGGDEPREPPAARGRLPEEQEKELDEALSFAERMMQRFFDMIRELKSEQQSQRI
jgi:hypothetical protein